MDNSAVDVAKQLVGWELYVKESDSSLTGGVIIETEAYTEGDAASHSYNGKTARNEVMFGESGRIYIYFTYGMHWCMNIVTGPKNRGEAVLIRAIQPTTGLEKMRKRRNLKPDYELANGPAKLCQALGITGADNGLIINDSKIILKPSNNTKKPKVKATPRIGIKKDTHHLWRFIVV